MSTRTEASLLGRIGSGISAATRSIVGGAAGAAYDHTIGSAVNDRVGKAFQAGIKEASNLATNLIVSGVTCLKKALVPSGSCEAHLRQAQIKVEIFYKKQPPGTVRPSLSISSPPRVLSSRKAIPPSPARGAEAPASPRVSLETQRGQTDSAFEVLKTRSLVYATLWTIHPASRRADDNQLLHALTVRVSQGERTSLWDEYISVFRNKLSFFERWKARIFCWICHDFKLVETIVSKLADNTLAKARSQWASGEKSKESIFRLASRFIKDIQLSLDGPQGDLESACKKASAEFLKDSNGYLNGLSWFQRLIVRWYFPATLESLLFSTLRKMKKDEFRAQMFSLLAAQVNSHYLKLGEQTLDSSTSPIRIPPLRSFFSKLRLDIAQSTFLNQSEDLVERLAEVGLDYLVSHPEQVEWMLGRLFQNTAAVFEPPTANLSSSEQESLVKKARDELNSQIYCFLEALIKKGLTRSTFSDSQKQAMKTAYQIQVESLLGGINSLVPSLKQLDSEIDAVNPSKFSSRLTTLVASVECLIEISKQMLEQQMNHQLDGSSKKAFDMALAPIHQQIISLMDVFSNLQDWHCRTINSACLASIFQSVQRDVEQLQHQGEGTNEALNRMKNCVQLFEKLLPPNSPELTQYSAFLSEIEKDLAKSQQVREWATRMAHFHSKEVKGHIEQIKAAIKDLLRDYQLGDTTQTPSPRASSSDSKIDIQPTQGAIKTGSAGAPASSPGLLQRIQNLALKRPRFSPPMEVLKTDLPAPIAEELANSEEVARIGTQVASKAVDFLLDQQGDFIQSAVLNLLSQFTAKG